MPRLGAVTSQGNGQAVVGVALMTLGENTRLVAQRLTTAVQQINKTLPPGVSIVPYYNRADLIDRVLQTVAHNLAEGGFLVIAVLLLLLGNVRAASSWRWPSRSRCSPPSRAWCSRPLRQPDEPGRDRLRPLRRWLRRDDREHRASPRRRRRCPARSSDVMRDAGRDVARPVSFAVAIIMLVYLPILS